MNEIHCTENGYDIYCHPVHTVESWLFEPPGETRTGLENSIVQEIRGKINVELGNDVCFKELGTSKIPLLFLALIEHKQNYDQIFNHDLLGVPHKIPWKNNNAVYLCKYL